MIGSDFLVGTWKWPSFFSSRLAASHHFFQSSLITSGTRTCWIWSSGGAVAEALQDQLDQIQMVQRGHLAQGFQVGNFAGVNVVAGNGLERFGGEGQVHGVAGLGLEIDDDTGRKPGPWTTILPKPQLR